MFRTALMKLQCKNFTASNKQEILYGLSLVAIALQLSSICTEHWSAKNLNLKDVNGEINIGLWKACGELWGNANGISGDMDVCIHLPPDGVKSFPKNSLYTT